MMSHSDHWQQVMEDVRVANAAEKQWASVNRSAKLYGRTAGSYGSRQKPREKMNRAWFWVPDSPLNEFTLFMEGDLGHGCRRVLPHKQGG